MYGYVTKFSIDATDNCCNNPSKFKKGELQQAINDAKAHYQNGNASKDWYNYVVRRLSAYL